MKKLILLFHFLLGVWPALAETALLNLARQQAAGGKLPEAIVSYQKILKAIPQKDPQREMVMAELIYALYSQKEYEKTIDQALNFLRTYRQSNFGFNISYIMAAAEFGLDRYKDAFAIFSGFPFDQVRVLPDDSRGKIYEVLVRSLVGMGEEPASQAMRADSAGLLSVDGKPLLTGTVQSVTDQVPDKASLEKLISQVQPLENQAAIRQLLGMPENVDEGLGLHYVGAIRLSSDSTNQPAMSQCMPQLQAGVEWRLTPAGSGGGLQLAIDTIGFGGGAAGERIRTAGFTGYLKMALYGEPTGYQLYGYSGVHYRTAAAVPYPFGFADLIGVFVTVEGRKPWRKQQSAGVQLTFNPYNVVSGIKSGFNFIFKVGTDYTFTGLWEKPNSVFLEWELLQYGRTETSLLGMSRLGLGYRVYY